MKSVGIAITICGVLVSSGCYTFAPTTIDGMSEGARVRATLSTAAQISLRDRVGYDRRFLDATFVEATGDTLLFSVKAAVSEREFGLQTFYQRVDVLRADVLRVDRRQIDAFRTGGLVAMLAGGATITVIRAIGDPGPGNPDGNVDPPAERASRRLKVIPDIWR